MTAPVSDRYSRTPVETLTWVTALDNHDPVRNHASGTALRYDADADGVRNETITLTNPDLPDAHKAVYLIDDGASVTVWYVAGWSSDESVVHLQPFPANPNGRTRPDGRVIDYTNWALGPRRAYHCKVTRQVYALTSDGVLVHTGLRVFTSDYAWGTVVEVGHLTENDDPWHMVRLDDGSKRIYNGERLTTKKP